MISAILFISFFIFLILGVPIGICLGLSSVCAILYSGTSLTIVATNMYSGISKFLLLAIPFFVLSGNIMAKAGISKRLIKFVDTCVGHKKGGIAIVCVIVACFFGAISGSGPATVAALGAVLIPAMVEQGGFSAPFSTALMATSSSIAIVIPPSIAFVVYASITGTSIADVILAGSASHLHGCGHDAVHRPRCADKCDDDADGLRHQASPPSPSREIVILTPCISTVAASAASIGAGPSMTGAA